MISILLQSIDYKTKHNNRAPFTIDDIYNLTKVNKTMLKEFIESGGDEYTKVTFKQGSYAEIEILKEHVILNYLVNPNISFFFKNLIYEIHKKEGDLPPKDVKSFLNKNQYYTLRKLFKEEINLMEETATRIKYSIDDNVGFDVVKNRFIYYSDSDAKEFRTNPNTSKETVYWDRKLKTIETSARVRGLEYDLTIEDMIEVFKDQKGVCYYSGLELSKVLPKNTEDMKVGFSDKNYSLSIDRLDNNVGYTKSNVVICLNVYNIMKRDMPEDQFTYFILKAAERINSRK